MTRVLVAYIATLCVFCILDFLWLGFVAKDFYRSQIGGLLLERPNWIVAVLFYAFYIVGVVVFVVVPALDAGSWSRALVYGALFGLFCYGTYDLTNLATLKGWSGSLAAADMAWGGVVTALSAMGGYYATRLAGLSP